MRAKRRFAALGTVGHLIKASEGNLNDQRSDERHLNGQCSEAGRLRRRPLPTTWHSRGEAADPRIRIGVRSQSQDGDQPQPE